MPSWHLTCKALRQRVRYNTALLWHSQSRLGSRIWHAQVHMHLHCCQVSPTCRMQRPASCEALPSAHLELISPQVHKEHSVQVARTVRAWKVLRPGTRGQAAVRRRQDLCPMAHILRECREREVQQQRVARHKACLHAQRSTGVQSLGSMNESRPGRAHQDLASNTSWPHKAHMHSARPASSKQQYSSCSGASGGLPHA